MTKETYLSQYKYTLENTFFNYLKDEEIKPLISELQRVENLIKEDIGCIDNGGLNIRFGNDSLVYTIRDIERDLNQNITPRQQITHLLELLRDAISLNPMNELKITYS